MEYKGIEYRIVQTNDGWKWTVVLNGRIKSGKTYSKKDAIFASQIAIDNVFSKKTVRLK